VQYGREEPFRAWREGQAATSLQCTWHLPCAPILSYLAYCLRGGRRQEAGRKEEAGQKEGGVTAVLGFICTTSFSFHTHCTSWTCLTSLCLPMAYIPHTSGLQLSI